MTGRSKLVTPPVVEPVGLLQALEQCHCDEGIEDKWFISRIRAGRQLAEEYQRQSYIEQTWMYTLDGIADLILLPRGPVMELESVTLYGVDNVATVLNVEDFYVDNTRLPARLMLNDDAEWPSITLRAISALEITYTAGYGDSAESVPEYVKDAILLYVAYSYNNRAGEDKIPDAFYNLLKPGRVY